MERQQAVELQNLQQRESPQQQRDSLPTKLPESFLVPMEENEAPKCLSIPWTHLCPWLMILFSTVQVVIYCTFDTDFLRVHLAVLNDEKVNHAYRYEEHQFLVSVLLLLHLLLQVLHL